jgi:hypothetical protein
MLAETITLNQDQAEDLRELLSYAQILEDWLLHAPDDILHELARFAYHEHFHPYSATWWLIEDLGHLGCRLRNTLCRTSARPRSASSCPHPTVKAIAETGTRPSASSRDDLDTATTIGNHKHPSGAAPAVRAAAMTMCPRTGLLSREQAPTRCE